MTAKNQKIRRFLQNHNRELFQPVSTVETGAEVSKTTLELALALGLLGSTFTPAALAVAGFSVVGLGAKFFKSWQEKHQGELELEECVTVVLVLAYLESCDQIAKSPGGYSLFGEISDRSVADTVREPINTLDLQLDQQDIPQAIACFRETKLAERLNSELSLQLHLAGLSKANARIFTSRVAWNTHKCIINAIAKIGEAALPLVNLYRDGWRQEFQKNESIEYYLSNYIAQQPLKNVFNEEFSFADVYVPLRVKAVNRNGQIDKRSQAFDLETWAKTMLEDPSKQDRVLFIQGGPGRGKSVFCRMFADGVRQHLHPVWTPILIRLRNIRTFENNIENTLKAAVNAEFADSDDGWLTDRNTRYLFLLDGFDELLMSGRTSSGLENFLKQVGTFQLRCQQNNEKGHRVLITGRSLSLQSIEKSIPENFERVEIQLMDSQLQQIWLSNWTKKIGNDKSLKFQEFLQDTNCPTRVRELAKEPLLLYLLAAMHRDGELTLQMFSGTNSTKAKILVYERTLHWVLTKQRPQTLNREIVDLEIEDLRRILTEAGLCVVQSGGEFASVKMIEERLKDDPKAKDLIAEARLGGDDSPLRNALAAFYLQPASFEGGVEFAHKSFGEFLFALRLKKSLIEWTKLANRGRGLNISFEQMSWEIYDLLSYGGLTPEIVEYLFATLETSSEFRPWALFDRLDEFYQRWCEGEFIDLGNSTLSQAIANKFQQQGINLVQRQIDIFAGLNVMILLLELHRHAQKRDGLKDKIIFYPSGRIESDTLLTDQLLRIIHYSDCMRLGNFKNIVGRFLSCANLSGANLSRADLSGVNFTRADLNRASLKGTNLSYANLHRANLNRANLSGADLNGADLSSSDLSFVDLNSSYLSFANLSGAILSGAKLSLAYFNSADLSKAYLNSAIISNAILGDADLNTADLTGAILSGSYFSYANLTNAILSDANLSRAYLSGANLSGADLTRANFNGADLSSVDFDGAKLSGTDFSGADLSGADFSGAEFIGEIRWNQNTRWKGVQGLEAAINVPESLKEYLGGK